MTTIRILAAAAACLLAATTARADEACHLYRIGSFDMNIDEVGGVEIPMTISGQPVNMLIDTGGVFSLLTEPTVTQLGLTQVPMVGMRFQMFGGTKITHYVTAKDVSLGKITGPQMQFLVLKQGVLPASLGGTLSPDILSEFDLDFDFAHAKFSFFSQDHCPGKVIYWAREGDYSVVDFRVDAGGHMDIPVQLDGQDIRVLVDSGATRSEFSLEKAEAMFGFNDKSPLLKDMGEQSFGHVYHYPFKSLTFGGVTVTNPDIMLVANAQSHFPGGGLLGLNVLKQMHVYVAYKEKKMYVSAATASR